MIEICDRIIKVYHRDKTQTINICIADGIHGVWEYIFRIYGKENRSFKI